MRLSCTPALTSVGTILFCMLACAPVEANTAELIPEVVLHKNVGRSQNGEPRGAGPGAAATLEQQIAALSAQVERSPQRRDLQVRLARLLLYAGFENLAADTLDRMERRSPGSFMSEFRKSADGEGSFAEEFLQYGHMHFADDPAVLYMTAKLLRKSNFPDKAKVFLNKLFAKKVYVNGMYALAADLALQDKQWTDALDFANKELKNNPNNSDAKLFRIWSLNMLGQPLVPETDTIKDLYSTNHTRSDMGILYANLLLQQGGIDEALEPALFGIWCNSGHAMQQVNRTQLQRIFSNMSSPEIDRRVRDFVALNHVEPLLIGLIYLNLGRTMSTLNRHEFADQCYRQCLAITPFFSQAAYGELASVLERQGKYQDAYTAYSRALDVDPNNKRVRAQFAKFHESFERLQARQAAGPRDIAKRLKLQGKEPAAPVVRQKRSSELHWGGPGK